MSDSLDKIKSLIQPSAQANTGRVLSTSNDTLTVATNTGIREVPRVGSTIYTAGDSVRVFNGVAVGKVAMVVDIPRYYV